MISAAQILNPVKPAPASTTHASILSLEVLIDEQPLLRGAADEAHGTDLSGSVCLALAAPLEASQIIISLSGAALEKSLPGGSSSAANPNNAIIVFESSRPVWSANATNKTLQPGAHDFRFMFKIPGTLPQTEAGRVQYILTVQIEDLKKDIVASFVEAVRIRRVLAGGAESELELPAYDIPPPDHDAQPIVGYEEAIGGGAPPTSANGEPPVAPGELPPSYDFKGKTKA